MAHSLVVWPQPGEPASFSAVGAPAEVMQSHTVGALFVVLWLFFCLSVSHTISSWSWHIDS